MYSNFRSNFSFATLPTGEAYGYKGYGNGCRKIVGATVMGVNNDRRARRKMRRNVKESTPTLSVVPSNFSAAVAPMVIAVIS